MKTSTFRATRIAGAAAMAMTLALADQRPVEDAAILGAAAGTAAVITPGTRLCIREDIFRIYDQLRRATARTVPAPTE